MKYFKVVGFSTGGGFTIGSPGGPLLEPTMDGDVEVTLGVFLTTAAAEQCIEILETGPFKSMRIEPATAGEYVRYQKAQEEGLG
jgi:hypothetical protein